MHISTYAGFFQTKNKCLCKGKKIKSNSLINWKETWFWNHSEIKHIKKNEKKQKIIKAVLCVFLYLRAQGVGEWTDPKYF